MQILQGVYKFVGYIETISQKYCLHDSFLVFVSKFIFKSADIKTTDFGRTKRQFMLIFCYVGGIKPLPKKATRNVTMAALLIEEVTRTLANE